MCKYIENTLTLSDAEKFILSAKKIPSLFLDEAKMTRIENSILITVDGYLSAIKEDQSEIYANFDLSFKVHQDDTISLNIKNYPELITSQKVKINLEDEYETPINNIGELSKHLSKEAIDSFNPSEIHKLQFIDLFKKESVACTYSALAKLL